MRVYYDPFFAGVGVGILFAIAWRGLFLPMWVIAVVAFVLIIGTYVGWVRTRREARHWLDRHLH